MRWVLALGLLAGCDRLFGLSPISAPAVDGRVGVADGAPDGVVADAFVRMPIEMIAAGEKHTCAIAAGHVRCWGAGANGRLGYGSTANVGDDELPFTAGSVPITNALASVATGQFHTCVLTSDQTVRCWGAGGRGRLGYANTMDIGDN